MLTEILEFGLQIADLVVKFEFFILIIFKVLCFIFKEVYGLFLGHKIQVSFLKNQSPMTDIFAFKKKCKQKDKFAIHMSHCHVHFYS